MESDVGDRRAVLDVLAADRRALSQRIVKPAKWYYPATAAGAALLVGAPAVGSVGGATMIAALVTIALGYIDMLHRKQTGLKMTLPVGPWSLVAALGFGLLIVILLIASTLLSISGNSSWILGTAALAGVMTLVCLWISDRVTNWELQRAL